jgi:ATP-binding cassette subfamily B protein
MAEKKLSYREVPVALKYVIRTLWRISPSYVIISIFYTLKDRLFPYVVLFIAAAITSRLPDLISHKATFSSVLGLLSLLLVLELISLLVDVLVQSRQQSAEAMMSIELREDFYQAYARLPYYLYEDKSVLDAFQYADQFMYRFSQFGLQQVIQALGSLLEIATATIALVAVAWYMPLLFLIYMPILARSIIRINREQAQVYYENRPIQRRIWAVEGLFYPRRIKETRLYGVVDYFLKDRRQNSVRIQKREQSLNVKRNTTNFWHDSEMQVAGFVASAIALWRITYRAAPIGIFVLAQQLTSRAATATKNLFSQISSFDQDLYGFAEFRYITETLQSTGGQTENLSLNDPLISFEKVGFKYPESEADALKDINLQIPFGESLAIVGENGAGKTTLVKLLLGLYHPQQGEVKINSYDLSKIREDAWLSRVGILLQDYGMFEDLTIREAIWLGNVSRSKSDEGLEGVLAQAGLLKRIQDLPHGLDSYLGKWMDQEKGVELSGGELQRLAIARALFRDPDTLILDEPTSSIDANAEEKIFNKLMKSRKDKTTIFISHRFSTVRRAERIAFMEKGQVTEYGTHEELMKLKGSYYQMFNSQAEGYK